MKDVLKKLAEALPAEYEARWVDRYQRLAFKDEANGAVCDVFLYTRGTLRVQSPAIMHLLQYIEEQGYNYQLSSFVNESPKVYRVTWCKTLKEARDGEQVAFGATIAEAVAKAALEVARRMK